MLSLPGKVNDVGCFNKGMLRGGSHWGEGAHLIPRTEKAKRWQQLKKRKVKAGIILDYIRRPEARTRDVESIVKQHKEEYWKILRKYLGGGARSGGHKLENLLGRTSWWGRVEGRPPLFDRVRLIRNRKMRRKNSHQGGKLLYVGYIGWDAEQDLIALRRGCSKSK